MFLRDQIVVKSDSNTFVDTEGIIVILKYKKQVGRLLDDVPNGSVVVWKWGRHENTLSIDEVTRIIDNQNELLVFLLDHREILSAGYENHAFAISGSVAKKVSTKSIDFIDVDILNGRTVRILVQDKSLAQRIPRWAYLKMDVQVMRSWIKGDDPGISYDIHLNNLIDMHVPSAPMQKEELWKSVSQRFKQRHIDLRLDGKNMLLYKSTIIKAIHDYFHLFGFVNIDSPKILGKSVDWPVDAVPLSFFGNEGYLAISDILAHMLAISGGFHKIYEIGPNFRQDPSRTKMHSSEFTALTFHGVDFKMADIMRHINSMLHYVANALEQEHGKGIVKLDLSKDIPVMTYREVRELLQSEGFSSSSTHSLPKSAADVIQRRVGDLVWITHQPAIRNPIYTVCNFDDKGEYIAHECELWNPQLTSIADGGERIIHPEWIRERILQKWLDDKNFSWLLEMVANGVPQHGGIWMGLERLSALLLWVENVREFRLLYRDFKTMEP